MQIDENLFQACQGASSSDQKQLHARRQQPQGQFDKKKTNKKTWVLIKLLNNN